MRADRLVALLLLLQRRGTVTAQEAATELEVSVRTARRDFEALSSSGVPVYSQAGRGGGWRLLGGGSTDLSGLTSSEARALFVAAGRSLDAHPHLRAALRKLAAALPEPFQSDAEEAATAVHFDDTTWSGPATPAPPPLLDAVTDAVIEAKRLQINYRSPRSGRSSRQISPLGLVSKRGTWYLLALTDDGQRTFRVDRIDHLAVLDGQVERPDTFDIDSEWRDVIDNVQAIRMTSQVEALVNPDMIWPVRWLFGTSLDILGRTEDDRFHVRLSALHDDAMAGLIAGFSASVELINPSEELSSILARTGQALVQRYGDGESMD